MPLWNTRLGQSAHTAAATSPTRSPASRRASTNISPIDATDSSTLSHTATVNVDASIVTASTSHTVPASASGYPGG